MLRLFFRLVGVLLLAGAFAALIIDGTRSIAISAVTFTPLGATMQTLFPAQFALLKPVALQHFYPWVWDPVLVDLLALPASLVAGILGIALLAATEKRRPKIGYAGR